MGERYIVHRTPLVHSSERMHEMTEGCWCFPEVSVEATTGTTWVTHREIALGDGIRLEANRTSEQGEDNEARIFGPRL